MFCLACLYVYTYTQLSSCNVHQTWEPSLAVYNLLGYVSGCQGYVCLLSPCFGCMLQDEASYIAGERAALLRAFRETLPSQQALGSLFHAVQHLTKRMDQEGNDVHQVSTTVTKQFEVVRRVYIPRPACCRHNMGCNTAVTDCMCRVCSGKLALSPFMDPLCVDTQCALLLQVQIALSSLSATLQAAKGRLDALEQMRIPSLEERMQEVSRTSAQVCNALVQHLSAVCAINRASEHLPGQGSGTDWPFVQYRSWCFHATTQHRCGPYCI